MSHRSWKQRIVDILEAIAEVRAFVDGVTLEQFAENVEKQKAVLADFTIIGEAARHVPTEVQAQYPSIEWRRMRDMRNIIVHVYFSVDAVIVWDTIQNDLPLLEMQLIELLRQEEKKDGRG